MRNTEKNNGVELADKSQDFIKNPHIDNFEQLQQQALAERKLLCIRFSVLILCLSFLIIGRSAVPDNEPACIVDNVQVLLDDVNYFILHNTGWRDGLQILCSLFMDVLFLSTAGHWVLYGKSSRLILTILFFFGVRTIVQKMWYSPFPAGFWWYDPGFPSLIVPYGRGSDFFFSGHIGFVVICGTEWARAKNWAMVAFSWIGGIYTAFVLLSYQVHYSIDIFTGLVFAHWTYMMVDSYKDPFDRCFQAIYNFIGGLSGKKEDEKGKYQLL